ncbi:MAG TPA: ExbD/TolR family protein [Thermoanaerobaculia bacterium]|nr:ExbD/TolR family protein [Thermoanaerobaculia bacterium]
MAFNTDSTDELGDMSEINVTPLVDVMLVLLIIFMITAPMLTQGLTVELPAAEGRSFETSSADPSTISITRAGVVFVDGVNLGSSDLEMTLGTMLRGKRIKRALLEADQAVPYGQVIHIVDIMNRAGVEQLGMVTRPLESESAGRRR